MRKGKSGVIAMMQFGSMLQFSEVRAFMAARAIHAHDCHLLNTHVHWHAQGVRDAVNAVLDSRAEGAILLGPTEYMSDSDVQQLIAAGIPLVSIGGVEFEGVPQVRSDFHQAVRSLTEHLIKIGHRRMTYLGSSPSSLTGSRFWWGTNERIAGFREAVAQHRGTVEGEVICEAFDRQFHAPHNAGKLAMQKLLQQGNRPDAVVCSNDAWAIGAIAACAEAGVRVPDEIAVTGVDNDVVGEFVQPPLTTAAQQFEAIANKAVETLFRLIHGEKLSNGEQLVRFPCELIVRRSCGATSLLGTCPRGAWQGEQEGSNV